MNNIITDAHKLGFLSTRGKVVYSKLLSPHLGILSAILQRTQFNKYGLYVFQALSQNVRTLFPLCKREVSSGGLGIHSDVKKAFLSCVGESLERYSMSFFRTKDLFKAKYNSIPKEYRYPKELLDIYGIVKLPPDYSDAVKDKIYWTKVTSLLTGRDRFWPASLIYLPFSLDRVAENTSTGVACHTNKRNALLSGMLEVIERDAQMVKHFTKHRSPKVLLDSIKNPIIKNRIQSLKKCYRIEVFKLPCEFAVPVYGVYLWRKMKSGIHFGIGASANLNSDVAIIKAINEAHFTFSYSKDLLDLREKDPEKIDALYQHYLFYQGDNFNLLLEGLGEGITYQKQVLSQKELYDNVEKRGYDVYYKDITTADIKSLGFCVVKTIIPGMIDLNKSHKLFRAGLLERRGFATVKNDLPHPFP